MAKPSVLIAMNTHRETHSQEWGRDFIALFCEAGLTPERVSMSESFRHPFVSPDNFVEHWWAQFAEMRIEGVATGHHLGPHWQRRKVPAGRGYVNHSFVNLRNSRVPGRIWYESRWSTVVQFEDLFENLVSVASPYTAMLHLFTEPELQKARSDAERDFQLGGRGDLNRRTLQNLGWATAFGGVFAEEVDVPRIKQAGFAVEKADDALIVKVTDNLVDVLEDFPRFSRRRAELKGLFRSGMFEVEQEPQHNL